MTPTQRIHAQIAAISLVVGALAAADDYLKPERGAFWLVAVVTMAAIWITVGVAYRASQCSAKAQGDRRVIAQSAMLAGVMLALALGAALLNAAGWADPTIKTRVWGASLGLLLVVVGNAAPKALSPLVERRCSPGQAQASKRFAGWVFVLAGLGYAAAWLSLAPALAETVSATLCAGAVILVIGRCAWAFLAPRRGTVG